MNIKDILSLSNVVDVRAADKMRVLQELCRRASVAVALPVEVVTREVLKRAVTCSYVDADTPQACQKLIGHVT